jgi:mannose-6-phosphate isomerase-like protein (cupin superfamily)
MKETIKPFQAAMEYYIDEGCHIIEMLQADADPQLSIARARVEPGVTTRWHRLTDTTERYVINEGEGLVEIGSLPPQAVGPGDVVLIPPGCRQRITNTGSGDLLFLAICSPPFQVANYQDIEDS